MKLKNSALQELYDALVSAGVSMFSYADSPVYKAFEECDEKLSDSVTFATIKDLQDRNDILEGSNKALLEANMKSISKTRKLEKEIDYLKKDKKQLEEALEDTKTTLVKANADRTNLQEACDNLSEENKQISELRRENAAMHELNNIKNEQIQALEVNIGYLKKRMNSLCGIKYDKYFQSRNIGYEDGQNNLWNMLQNVSDYYYFGGDDEFDTDDCEMTSMTDIIDNLNVDQFLEAYKNWHKAQEQHRIDRMRDWLHDFCANRFCKGCPLASNEYKCGRGYSFTGAKPIPDEDIERYYEKARKTWTCTLEGTVEIDKDLLKKVCGIDSDD